MSNPSAINFLDPNIYIGGMPDAELKALREAAPLHYLQDELTGVPYWLVTQQKELDYISQNPDIFSSQVRTGVPMEYPQELIDNIMSRLFLHMDEPRHTQYRRLANPMFSPKSVGLLEQGSRVHARAIIDAVIEKGECDFVRDIAAELPLLTILELFGIPGEDRKNFFDWTNTMLFADDPDENTSPEDGQMASFHVISYAQKLYKKYTENPNDSLLSKMVGGKIDGELLSEEDFCWMVVMIIVAGNESTRTTISHGMRQLIEHPEQLRYLQENPDKIGFAIEEIIRCNPPFVSMRRTALEDVSLGGQEIKRGDKIVLHYHTVNRESGVFGEDSDQFDVRRIERKPELAREIRSFGIGSHFCMGKHLARMEMQVMFEELIPRIKNPVFTEPVVYMRSYFIQGVKRMPIRFDKGVQLGPLAAA
ncbi:cytochrome P450 [Zhongshania sp.]|uniref:cytochrome P450 n=1 Tax=Zhongshania sp. TaxID=1971902 RepID=UPI00356A7C31